MGCRLSRPACGHLFLWILLSACQLTKEDTKLQDIATDIPTEEDGVSLYFIQSEDLIRGRCRVGLPPSRNACAEEIGRKKYEDVKKQISAGKLDEQQATEAQLDEVEASFSELEERLGVLRNQQTGDTRQLEEKTTERRDAQRQLSRADTDKDQLQIRIEELEISLGESNDPNLRREHDEKIDEFRSIQAKIETLTADVIRLDDEITSLTESIDQRNPEITRLTDEAQTLQQEESALQTRLAELVDQNRRLQRFLSKLEAEDLVFKIRDDSPSYAELKPFLERLADILAGGPGLQGKLPMVAAGSTHTCSISAGGVARCWGSGRQFKLGNSSQDTQVAPVLIADAGETLTQISLGDNHTCALGASGAIYCWGANGLGQLGVGTLTMEFVPKAINTDKRFVQVSAGGMHTCAIAAGGQAFCWGHAEVGATGTGLGGAQDSPTAVAREATFLGISAGQNHTCAVTDQGELWCWGTNNNLQIGNDHTSNYFRIPQKVSHEDVSRWRQVSCGQEHTCALSDAGKAYCWGGNAQGQVGVVSPNQRAWGSPQAVATDITFQSITAGQMHTCALTSEGQPYCWGSGGLGQLGNDLTASTRTPVPVASENTKFRSLSAGIAHNCGMTESDKIFCWGYGNEHRLGNGSTGNKFQPTLVPTFDADEERTP